MGPMGDVSQSEYLLQANDALVTIVQIETKEALENVSDTTVFVERKHGISIVQLVHHINASNTRYRSRKSPKCPVSTSCWSAPGISGITSEDPCWTRSTRSWKRPLSESAKRPRMQGRSRGFIVQTGSLEGNMQRRDSIWFVNLQPCGTGITNVVMLTFVCGALDYLRRCCFPNVSFEESCNRPRCINRGILSRFALNDCPTQYRF